MISTVALPILLGTQAREADAAGDNFQVPILRENAELPDPVPASATSAKGGSGGDAQRVERPPAGAQVAPKEAPRSKEQERKDREEAGPKDKTLWLTIPAMARVDDRRVPSTRGDDEEALRNNVAIHLKGTGFPWQKGANTYIAGHRLGYPVTGSFLGFYDLNVLKKGDEILVRDANGKEYRYRVYHETVVNPSDLSITQPVPGKDVLTLQTCTLPDYTQRLIVQAEKVT
jgi:sortase A